MVGYNIAYIDMGIQMLALVFQTYDQNQKFSEGELTQLQEAFLQDPELSFTAESSIHDLAFTLTLTQEQLAEIYPGLTIDAKSNWRSQTLYTSLFTAVIQILFCVALFGEFSASIEAKEYQITTEPSVVLTKVLASIVFHFLFAPEIQNSI